MKVQNSSFFRKYPMFNGGISARTCFAIKPGSIDLENRTVDVVWTTGARTFHGEFELEISLDPSHVRMERLNNSAPVLDNHYKPTGLCGGPAMGLHGRSQGQIGVVESASIQDGAGLAKLRFSKREGVKDIFEDIADGIIRNISVGFFIFGVEKVEEQEGEEREIPLFKAVDWEPIEISPVPAGADDGAKIRSTDQTKMELFIDEKIKQLSNTIKGADNKRNQNQDKGSNSMPVENTGNEQGQSQTVNNKKGGDAPSFNEDQVREQASKNERERISFIHRSVEKAGLPKDFADELITQGVEKEKVAEKVLEKMESRSAGQNVSPHVEVGRDNTRDHMMKGLRNALLSRGNPAKYKIDDHGRDFRGTTLVRAAESILSAGGVNTRTMTKHELVTRALGTSDFPLLLEDTMNKTLRDSYEESPQTFAPFVRRVEVPDFKEISRTQYGDAPKLKKVKEGGPVELGKIGEAAEKYKVETFARKLRMTRQMIINDDLDALIRTPEKFGRSARATESENIWDLLSENSGNGPTMADGLPLFHADHGNLIASPAAALGVDSVGALLSLLRKQKGINGQRIRLVGEYLVVPVSLQTAADKFFADTTASSDSNANPYKNRLAPVSEPILDDISEEDYYVFAGAGQIDMFEMAHLEGSNMLPIILTRDLGGVDGIEVEAIHDIGTKVIDHRGFTKHVGN